MTTSRKTLLAGLTLAWLFVAAPGGADAADEPWMGVFLGDAVDGGVRVVALVPDGPAERAGLRAGDVVVQAEATRVVRSGDLTRALRGLSPGKVLRLQLLRAGRTLEREVELASRPPSAHAIPPDPPLPAPLPLLPGRGSSAGAYGIRLADVTPDLRRFYGAPAEAGVLVVGIDREGPAARDGFRVGDVLVRLDDRPVRDVDDVAARLSAEPRGTIAALFVREGRSAELLVRSPAVDPSGADPSPPAVTPRPPGQGGTRRLEQVLEREIERLERRIAELRDELEALRSRDDGDPGPRF